MNPVVSIRLNILLTVLLLLSALMILHLKDTVDDQQEILHTLVQSQILQAQNCKGVR